MSKHKKLYNNKPYGNGPNSVRKAKAEQKLSALKQFNFADTKAFWEFSFHQKNVKANEEQKIKSNLRTENMCSYMCIVISV